MKSVSMSFRRLSAIALAVGCLVAGMISGSPGVTKAAGFESLRIWTDRVGCMVKRWTQIGKRNPSDPNRQSD